MKSWYRTIFAQQIDLAQIRQIAEEERKQLDQSIQTQLQEDIDSFEIEIEQRGETPQLRQDLELFRARQRGEKKAISPSWCRWFAGILTDSYKSIGLNSKTVMGSFLGTSGHFWTEINDNLVVDITADQFGEQHPSVIIGTYDELPQYQKVS